MTGTYPTVSLDRESHTYTVQEGKGRTRSTLGVTSLLTNAGISPHYYNSDRAARFGTVGHEIMRLFLLDDLEEYDPEFEPWMEGLRLFRQECKPADYQLETPVYSQKLDYAGQLDFLGLVTPPRQRRETYILDWKFWSKATPAVVSAGEIQSEGYGRAALEMGVCTRKPYRALVHFFPGGYNFHLCHDPAAWSIFMSCLNIERWKRRYL